MANLDENNIKIGSLLQSVRESHGIRQSELCEATGLSKNHISAVERGVSKASIRMLLGYCEKLGVTPNDILGYKEPGIEPELQELLGKMDTEKQNKIIRMIKLMEEYGGAQSGGILRLIDGVETALDETDKFAEEDGKRYTHEERRMSIMCCFCT